MNEISQLEKINMQQAKEIYQLQRQLSKVELESQDFIEMARSMLVEKDDELSRVRASLADEISQL